MTFIVKIQVCRDTDRETVAKLSPITVQDPITRSEADSLRNEGKRLSRVYGKGFHVEVWAWWPHLGGDAYHRAYVYVNGKTACAVGF